jgi:hypothetical protein
MNVKIKIKDGKAKYVEYDTLLNPNLEDGLYVGDLQIYNKIPIDKVIQCAKPECSEVFLAPLKSNIKYCKGHRRKR